MIFRAAHWREDIATGRLRLDLSDRLYRVEPGDEGQPEVTPEAIVTLAFDSKGEAKLAALTEELTERRGRAPLEGEPFWLVSDDESADETLRSATPSELAVFEQAWNRRRADHLALMTPEEVERESRTSKHLADQAERSREVEAWEEAERIRAMPSHVQQRLEVLTIWCDACSHGRLATVYQLSAGLLLSSNRPGKVELPMLQRWVQRGTLWLADERPGFVVVLSCRCSPGTSRQFPVRAVTESIHQGRRRATVRFLASLARS